MNNNSAVASYPADYAIDPTTIRSIDNFTSINSAVQVDLFSQVNGESSVVNGVPKQISGNGGMTDFVYFSQLSKGGKSFICLESTYTDREGKLHSRIVPTLEAGTIVTSRASSSTTSSPNTASSSSAETRRDSAPRSLYPSRTPTSGTI
jgi:acyl-CoA hydrolase